MRTFLSILCFFNVLVLDACVEYDKNTGTYTVDPSGSVDVDDEFLDDEWDDF
jgi:hypothetical protein